MEVEEIQTRKFARLGNGRTGRDDEESGKVSGGGAVDGANRIRGWNPHHASRIIRVSRASGGKDRHSKVWTSKGPRDRRVRLSVGTAIQFYDLQDRLGYDQPSKAVEWLIKAAADSISELPSLNASFSETPKQLSDEKRASGSIDQAFDSVEADLDGDGGNADPDGFHQNQSQQHLSLSKSACSSTSDTSKNSGLSFSRSEIRVNRVKARERARERAAKEKEIQQNSLSELLSGGNGIGSLGNNNSTSPPNSTQQNANSRHWASTPMDYFETGGLLGPSLSRSHNSSVFSGQIQLGNSLAHTMSISPYSEYHHNQELHQFSFVPDHIIPVATTQGPGADYDLNFSISSGLSSFNRGTLQSNSPSFLPQLQRFDGSPFFIGTSPVENHHHHQFPDGFDPRLQLWDGRRNLDQKGKGKN